MLNALTMLALFVNDAQQSIAVEKFPSVTITRDCFDKWTLIFSGLLAVVGLLGIFLAWRTVTATRDNAKAARLNAEALVNSERPWLVAEVVKDSQMSHHYEIQITNNGRTPARFLRGDAFYTFADRPDSLQIPPNYSSPFVLPKQLLIATGKGFTIPHGYSVANLRQKPEAINKTLVIYGRVLYEDTIIPGIEHETRWCFGYIESARGQLMVGDFVLTGPSEYTKNS